MKPKEYNFPRMSLVEAVLCVEALNYYLQHVLSEEELSGDDHSSYDVMAARSAVKKITKTIDDLDAGLRTSSSTNQSASRIHRVQ